MVARTAGAHRKYYYRRREPNGWTPWDVSWSEFTKGSALPVPPAAGG